MSTHRRIEWSLFILGLISSILSIATEATWVQTGLFMLATFFAGLHVFHLYDGHKSNHIVVASALTLIVYTSYLAIMSLGTVINDYAVLSGIVGAVLLSILSLRLRRDFHKK